MTRIVSILAEMELYWPVSFPADVDIGIKDIGPHRLFSIALSVRKDVIHAFQTAFTETLMAYNALSKIKIDVYSVEEYPGVDKEWLSVYLTVVHV